MADAPAVLSVTPLEFVWATRDPFLFCVHHEDAYPAGNERMGPAASLAGRDIGMDFAGKDGWRMYHGDVVPGFPRHPHRGFETITIARRGFIDHSDSLGATARFGAGDVQWMTAGRGIVHSEMFPLVDRGAENPAELFQIWLNLPREDKMAPPQFSMLWRPTIPRRTFTDDAGRTTRLTVVAGRFDDLVPPDPPARSWAARPEAAVAIWSLALDPGASFSLPAGPDFVHRTLYLFRGRAKIDGRALDAKVGITLRADARVPVAATDGPAELLLLQGKPIREPTVQHGPFVMSSPEEIQHAFADYHRTQFGGWPWPADGPVHARERGRFAVHADGRTEEAPAD